MIDKKYVNIALIVIFLFPYFYLFKAINRNFELHFCNFIFLCVIIAIGINLRYNDTIICY